MDRDKEISGALPTREERIRLDGTFRGKYRVFAAFLICCGLLLAAFAISAVWLERGGEEWLRGLGSFLGGQTDLPPAQETSDDPLQTDPTPEESLGDTAEGIPEGATPIASMDLAYLSLGREYIHNETVYTPDVNALLERDVGAGEIDDKPLVLILHTHTSEAYLPSGTRYIEGAIGDATYSRDAESNVLAVGKVLCDTLLEKGITAIHCTVMHDDPTLSGSYVRADETIRRYLEAYPSIEYVIDLHRDAVSNSKGEFIRTVYDAEEAPVAQVMAVVGSDGNGTVHDGWEGNLALALRLRELLNTNGAAICRPISLRNASYNQELAPHSLLLEIGTAANSVEEAKRAAVLVGSALAYLLQSS